MNTLKPILSKPIPSPSMENWIECVPNVSEGRRLDIVDILAAAIANTPGVYLLHTDTGFDANRTVFTFVGPPHAVKTAAYHLYAAAIAHLDMRTQSGEHTRNGAVDVCPFVPLSPSGMTDCITHADSLAKKVGSTLKIPVYLYGNAARHATRVSLNHLRRGQYEALPKKLAVSEWMPDEGPHEWTNTIARFGATQIGARPFLLAWNVNLATDNVSIARSIARKIRTSGDPKSHSSGCFPHLMANGWHMANYNCTQVTMNLTDYTVTGMAKVYHMIDTLAQQQGTRITGSEPIGMFPLQALRHAGQDLLSMDALPISDEIPEETLLHTAIERLGLSAISPFIPRERIIEYRLGDILRA